MSGRGWQKRCRIGIGDGCRAVLYERVSTDKQVQDGHGLDVQRHRLDEVTTARPLDVVEVVADEGLSGKDLDRPGLQGVVALGRRRAV